MMEEEDRSNILALFQAATGIDNLETAFSSLEEVEWNLDKALEIYGTNTSVETPPTPPRVPRAPRAPKPPSLPLQAPSGSSGPMETFRPQGLGYTSSSFPILASVRFENKFHSFNVYSTKLISDFKREICVALNIPSTHLYLSGWPCLVNDNMTLGDCCQDPLACTLKLQAERTADENRVVCLQLTYPPAIVEEITFPVSNTIMELKQHVAQKSGILVKDQAWSGLPVGASDNAVIRNCNFKNPIHAIAVNSKNSFLLERPADSNHSVPNKITPQLDQVLSQESTEVYSDYSDSEPDIDLIEDDLDDVPRDNFRDSMIPEHCIDQSEALALFSENFEKRYGTMHPTFYCGSMKDVIDSATKVELEARRPVAVYLHHDRSISSNIFCQRILCSETIASFLSANYLIWAWDMTLPTNNTRFLDNVSLHFGDEIRNQLSSIGPSRYPLLLIFQKKTGTPLEIATMLTIDTPHDEALSMLVAGYEQHLAVIDELREVGEARRMREEIKREQDEAYTESTLRDQRILNDRRDEQLKRIVSQENKLRQLAMDEEYRKVAEGELPDEPEKGPEVSSIRFRFPSGYLANRRFLSTDRISLLFKFVHSKGFSPLSHRLILNFPKKDLGDFEGSSSLQECGLFPQAMVYVEEQSVD